MALLTSLQDKLQETLEERKKLDQQLTEREEYYRKISITNSDSLDSQIVCLLHSKHPEIYYELLESLED